MSRTLIIRAIPVLVLLLLLVGCGGNVTATATPPATATVAAPTESAGQTVPAPTEATTSETGSAPAATDKVVRLMTHDSFSVSEEVLAAFTKQTGARIEILKSGDSGSALNQAILSKGNPLADAFFGVDNTFLSRALTNDIFVPYESSELEVVPAALRLDPENRVTPIDYGDVCLNYDKAYFNEQGIPPPASLEDLAKPRYKGLTVVENPATSSPGLAFLLATIAHFGEDGWQDYWKQLRDNDVLVSDGWEDAYYTQFSGGSGQGSRPIVVSYASSPAAEVIFADPQPAEAPTASVLAAESCFRQIEFAGVLQNAKEPELAKQFIDFMLSTTFQEDIPLQMFVYPVRPGVSLPEAFTLYAEVSPIPAEVEPAQIEQNREQWIEGWTDVVLR
jgi:thiamine transport system substrate-binding protein